MMLKIIILISFYQITNNIAQDTVDHSVQKAKDDIGNDNKDIIFFQDGMISL